MKFKEFNDWCSERACDGRWGSYEAINCATACAIILAKPFWKREKFWENYEHREMLERIVDETNKIIERVEKETVF